MKNPILQSVRIRNFKAIRDSGNLKLTPFTVFIGNNGSGKSSLLEGLETLRTFVTSDIDAAMQMWRGIEHVRNKAKQRQTRFAESGQERSSKPIEFRMRGRRQGKTFATESIINERGRENELFVEREQVKIGRMLSKRDEDGRFREEGGTKPHAGRVPLSKSLLNVYLKEYIESWQFLALWPQAMGNPVPQTRTRGQVALAKDGANIAEYLMDIRQRDQAVFEEILERLKWVLPYAADLQPVLTSELERTVYLQMTEGQFKVPGWLLSTGTLRILSLLAVLRHPMPPPLIVVEEIENGLDPRTIHLLLDEIRDATQEGRTQVIVTTHSPYFLDLVPLQTLVLVEREEGGEPVFWRPSDVREVREWAKRFAPGELYTTGRLRREVKS